MTTSSLLTGKCVRAGGCEDLRFVVYGSPTFFGKELVACDSLRSRIRLKDVEESKARRSKGFCVSARVIKGKKHDYPWPADIDPNLESGHLAYLSSFKPLPEKPKPVTLDFEKPLLDLEKKIIEVRRIAEETGLDFSEQIISLENKYEQALKDLYKHLTPIQRVSIARHPNRPTVLDHIINMTDKWVELHGDRAGYDDPAIVTGIGSMDGKSYMFIGHQKGRNTKENIARNFAMPTPHGYRKALRMMKYAVHHSLPIVTFIDTPGLLPISNLRSLGEAIARDIWTMFGLKVPTVTVVTGEGGSGGALAIGCANKLYMLENSVFYVASPEACGAILWKTSQAAPKAAEKLRITAQEHYKRGIADGIIPEPLGGAHADPVWTSQQIKVVIKHAMEELGKMDSEEVVRQRMIKYRSIGGFQEGIPLEPERKRNMKPSEVNAIKATDIELELENLKKKILEVKGPYDPVPSQAIEKIKQDVDKEITRAFISMGLQEKLESIKLELSKTPNSSSDQPISENLKEKIDKILQEFKQKLSTPGAYLGLKQKLEKLNTVSMLIEWKAKAEKFKEQINQKIPPEVKAKIEILRNAQEKLSKGDPIDSELAEEVEKVKKELQEVLKSANLEIVGITKRKTANLAPGLEQKVVKMNEEIKNEIERAIKLEGLDGKIEELKAKKARGLSPGEVEKLESEIKERIAATLNASVLKENFESLRVELTSQTTAAVEGKVGVNNGRMIQ
ncbi:Acetyl-CoA carboxylase, alpha subunit [Dillenia turbinata]|uniref:acetyl-CoA carboxytransferase n=1 Tax=Dillenia turbinata TaxID=194707 RepID=A0AAN8YZ71_9MAGN